MSDFQKPSKLSRFVRKAGLVLAMKRLWDSMEDPKVIPQKKYDLVIGLKKAASTFAQGYAGFGVAFSTALDGTIFPTDWETFRRQWPQIVIPLVLALIRAGWNAYKHGALPVAPAGVKGIVIMLACGGMLVGSGPCVTTGGMTAQDAAVIGGLITSTVAASVAVYDAHKTAEQDRENRDAAAKEALAQARLKAVTDTAATLLPIVLPPKPAPTGAAK